MDKMPVPEGAVQIDFSVSDGVLAAAEGLPPLSKATVTGTVSGVAASLKAPSARVEMRDGRALAASEGSFAVDDFWTKDKVGRLAFRLAGGADALGSLLRSPLIQEVGGVDLDPATIKGRTDLRIAVPLPLDAIPKLAELPLAVSGTVVRSLDRQGLRQGEARRGEPRGRLRQGQSRHQGRGQARGRPGQHRRAREPGRRRGERRLHDGRRGEGAERHDLRLAAHRGPSR